MSTDGGPTAFSGVGLFGATPAATAWLPTSTHALLGSVRAGLSSTTLEASDGGATVASGTSSGTLFSTDAVPPTFAGVTSATGVTLDSATLNWTAANDAVTPQSALVYEVCYATTLSGATSGFSPQLSSAPGATSVTVGGLSSGTLYYFCVRARDAAGNRDTNNVTSSATTSSPTPPDTTPPTFGGITGLVSPTRETLTATWAAATDSVTAQNALEYDACWGTSSGAVTGSNFSAMVTSTPGATSVVIPGLAAGTLYYVCVRARDAAGNEDTNNVTASATTAIADVASPTVGNYVPALSSTIAATDSIQFDVLDNASMRSVVVAARYQTNAGELVHDGSQFLWPFTLSTRTIISGGYRYVVTRTGGWQAAPSIQVFAVDTSGNLNT